MKLRKRIIHLGLASMLCISAAQAEPQPTREVVLEAAQQATPTQRFQAAKFLEKAYPGVQNDLRSQLKSHYPQLEHKIVDAGLTTWEKHPNLFWDIRRDVRKQFGPRIKSLRDSVMTDMEKEYPNFQARLSRVLEEHGMASHWVRDVETKAPGFLGRLKAKTGWYPGRLRALFQNDPDSLAEVRIEPQKFRVLVTAFRSQAPSFAQEWASRRTARRMELVSALRQEFPGGGPHLVAAIEKNDPTLMGEVWSMVGEKTTGFRADLKAEVDAVLPGVDQRLCSLVESRYPDLKPQILKILKG